MASSLIDHDADLLLLVVCIFWMLFEVFSQSMTPYWGLLAQLEQDLKSSAKTWKSCIAKTLLPKGSGNILICIYSIPTYTSTWGEGRHCMQHVQVHPYISNLLQKRWQKLVPVGYRHQLLCCNSWTNNRYKGRTCTSVTMGYWLMYIQTLKHYSRSSKICIHCGI